MFLWWASFVPPPISSSLAWSHAMLAPRISSARTTLDTYVSPKPLNLILPDITVATHHLMTCPKSDARGYEC